jgi:hypothetical protein
MKQFMDIGCLVWLLTGNLDTKDAVKIVEHSTILLNLKPLKVQDIQDGEKTIRIKPNQALLFEHNVTGSNCCALTYFEIDMLRSNLAIELTT